MCHFDENGKKKNNSEEILHIKTGTFRFKEEIIAVWMKINILFNRIKYNRK